MENTLYQIFTSDYDRTSFEENVLKPIFKESAQKFVLYDTDGEQEIQLTETDLRTAKKVVKYGEFTTHDNRKVELYEITVEDFSKVKIARVGLGALVKKLIIGNNAVFATFRYEDTRDKHWRFSFIAYDSFFQDGQVQTTETNPKRYTYVFGDEHETYRTATDRFLELESKNKIKVKDIQDAFAVEAMSKEFFDEYRETHYAKFIKYLTGDEFIKKGGKYELVPVQNPSPFLASVFNGDKVTARDFCKKLLGQIVFLYFLQKKGWMGSPTGNYKNADGDKNFMQNFFNQAGADDTFYTVWLTKLFYDTLNKERENDDFEMPDKSIVKIPYLNGGLFDKESEKHDFLTFPKELFTDLFEFFNRFNFTIYENSPEEHTVAVDPEMLGHIFENLLEDNKDKGTFYTPKEIVHYMTQESLIEYLVTHLGENTKEGIDLFVKQKNNEQLSVEQLNEINNLLDRVKICDPAIGSGAFPMGLLQEIFTLKERIAFDLGYSVWSPATVKENIIQNSIYGVDIEKGAVDIAQLRFWLSLIVDADVPKALPNLAYKIVVGNSLVSKFEDEVIEIDWSTDSAKGGLFAQELIEKKIDLLKQISEKQKSYFKAKGQKKEKLAKEIRTLKLDILSTELKVMIETKGTTLDRNAKPTKKQMDGFLQTEGWRKVLTKTELLKNNNKPFSHFDWALDFPELLNPLIIEDKDKRGFDIVIGNPPYFQLREIDKILQKQYKQSKYFEFAQGGRINVYQFFIPFSISITNKQGITCLITQNSILAEDTAILNRKFIFENTYPIGFFSFPERDNLKTRVFESAKMSVAISLLSKSPKRNNDSFKVIVWSDKLMTKSSVLKTSFSEIKSLYGDKLVIPSANDNTLFFLKKLKSLKETMVFKSQAGEIDMSKFKNDFVSDKANNIRVYTGAQILRYKTTDTPSQGNVIYLPIDKIPNTPKSRFRHVERICMQRITGVDSRLRLIMTILPENSLCANSTNFIGGLYKYDLRYCLGVLNSKLINFYFKLTSTNTNITTTELNEIPIPIRKSLVIPIIVDLILLLNNRKVNILENTYLIEDLEEVIDALVFELYFPEEFMAKDIEIEKYANSIFKSIDGLSEVEQLKAIQEAYQILREKDNPLRNQIKLMKIELKELLLPILSV